MIWGETYNGIEFVLTILLAAGFIYVVCWRIIIRPALQRSSESRQNELQALAVLGEASQADEELLAAYRRYTILYGHIQADKITYIAGSEKQAEIVYQKIHDQIIDWYKVLDRPYDWQTETDGEYA